MLAATAGSVLGALILYALGRRVGEERLRRFIRDHAWIPFIGEEDIDRAHDWLARHGSAVLFFGRLIPFIRSGISLPAGFTGMGIGQFLVYTIAGSAIWNGVLIGLGWALGSRWDQVRGYALPFEYAVLAVLVILVARFIWKRRGGRDGSSPRSAPRDTAPRPPTAHPALRGVAPRAAGLPSGLVLHFAPPAETKPAPSGRAWLRQ